MFFNSQKFHYVSYSLSQSSNGPNVYVNPDLEITNLIIMFWILVFSCLETVHLSSIYIYINCVFFLLETSLVGS